MKVNLGGVYAAAVTPLTASRQPDLNGLPRLLDFLEQRGCHGSLLLGTTGEGPSFSGKERTGLWQAAAEWRRGHAGFRLLAGTGTPSLRESVDLTQAAFGLGFEAVVALPPFFFRSAGENGLYDWFAHLIESGVPKDRLLLGYHIPAVSGVPLPLSLLQRLDAAYPSRFGGLKDSSGNLDSARSYAAGLPGKAVMVGNDKMLGPGLAVGAAGCITAGANLHSPHLRAIYDAHHNGQETSALQSQLDALRAAMDAMPPAPAYVKAMLHARHGLPRWPVMPPLKDFNAEQSKAAMDALAQLKAA
ncbi:MAG: dihydrodipicolinate synthase family protein [Anaerolineales bacterium]